MAFENEGGGAAETGGAADLLGGAAAGGGAGGDTGVAAGAAAGADGGEAPGAGDGGGEGGAGFVAPDWFEKLSAQPGDGETSSNRDYAQAKGFKDLDGVFKSLRHAERAIHDKGMVAVPKDGAKPEEVAAFRAAIGVPDKPDAYEVKGPEGVPLNEPLIASLRESAIKHGAPKVAFEGLVNDFIQLQMDEAAAERTKQDGLAQNWLKEQGAKGNEMLAHVNSAARALQLSPADMQGLRGGLGADRALALLSKLGAGMAEDVLITGGKGRFGVSGAEAQTEIDKLRGDQDFMKKVMIAGSPEKARYDRLNQASAEWKAAQEQQM